MKFGGTSVGDVDRIKNVAQKVKAEVDAGNEVAVVVSAMSGETDKLTAFAHAITGRPDEREMDMLLSSGERVTSALTAMAITELGCGSISLTGRQVGIRTDSSHTKAMIESIGADRLKEALDEIFAVEHEPSEHGALGIWTLGKWSVLHVVWSCGDEKRLRCGPVVAGASKRREGSTAPM